MKVDLKKLQSLHYLMVKTMWSYGY